MGIDPKLQYCRCGMTWKFNTLQKIMMLIFGEYKYRCPQCQTVMVFRLIHHEVKIDTKTIKNREKVWRNG